MESQLVSSAAPRDIGSSIQPSGDKTDVGLYCRIADLSALVASLNDAVRDLARASIPPLNEDFDFYNEVRRFESSLIKGALRLTGGSQAKAAKLLQLNATTLNAKIRTLKLSPREDERP